MKNCIIKHYKEIERLQSLILKYQEKCKHKNLSKKAHGDTGNYDPSNDRYWYEYHCFDCNKRWTEDVK